MMDSELVRWVTADTFTGITITLSLRIGRWRDCSTVETPGTLARPATADGGRPVYASPIAINGKLFLQTRNSGIYMQGDIALN